MVGLITKRHHGLKESDVTRLIQGLVISRITYSAPCLEIKISEAIFCRAYKETQGLSPTTATATLLSLGVYNTMEERVKARLISEPKRLALILTGIRPGHSTNPGGRTVMETLCLELRKKPNEAPIPDHHTDGRSARAKYIHSKFGSHPDSKFIDAAK
ncbi:hypothetical protein HPB48_012065 [Haemaphysalis longicornis]|uniref:Uncharacterized protein n=1 Tax=Haemaphysalis longicornis TaxID=44386 RepID=A0A9J6H5F1_HAELO|nr:hypothetical protein HPB48_012065 [Haemaphysalis longicornis]